MSDFDFELDISYPILCLICKSDHGVKRFSVDLCLPLNSDIRLGAGLFMSMTECFTSIAKRAMPDLGSLFLCSNCSWWKGVLSHRSGKET